MRRGISFLLIAMLLCTGCAANINSPNNKENIIQYKQAMEDYDAGNYDAAFKEFLPLAQRGDPSAQYEVGYLYEHGEGVKQDYVLALNWLQKAAVQGESGAQLETGYLYDQGEGATQDYKRAYRWYMKAAIQGNTMAENNIGWMYEESHGVPQDNAEAMKWYLKASAKGNSTASINIAQMYLNGYGVKKDEKECIKWYTTASDQGDMWADIFLGKAYLRGEYGLSRNPVSAEIYFNKVGDQTADDWQQFEEIIHDVIDAHKTYPKDLIKKRVTGTVQISFEYRGAKPFNVAIEKSSGNAELDEAGLKAVKDSVFPLSPEPLKNKLQFTIPIIYML